MSGESCHGGAAQQFGMWVAMMAAMMLPSVAPTLLRYREALRRASRPAVRSILETTSVGLGYFFVWSMAGAIVVAPGAARLGSVAPFATGLVVVAAGALQFTAWKARHLACCRRGAWHGGASGAPAGPAWRDGVRLGVHCVCSCAGATAVMIVSGMMDLPIMAIVTAAIMLERVLPAGARVARVSGAAAIVAGVALVAQAV